MRKDPKEFRERFYRWKAGELVYKDGLPAYKDGKEPGKINWSRWDDAELTSYPVPFIDEKRITLTNAGRATGAVLSTNLLDSIADNANRAGLPLLTALGLAVKESTLGNPTDDRSAWNLSSGIRQAFNNKYPGTELHINYWGDALNEREDVINYHKGHQSDDPNSKGKSVLQEAFEFYRLYPDKYNPGQPGYLTAVNKRGEEVMQSPEIKRWKNARDTKKIVRPWTKPNLLLKESKFNLPKYAEGIEGDDWYKYVQAGKNNEWSRITNDDMSLAFLDLVARPLSRGGNTTEGNWKRQWAPKYEKPLELISPEFDIISGARGILNMLPSKKITEKVVESGPKDYLDWSTWSKGGEISKLHLNEYENIVKKYKNTPQWLRMEDGSKFRGDPRSWVQLMSKDAKKSGLRKGIFPSYENIVYSGVRSGKINPEYIETQWSSKSPLIARSYAPNDDAVQQLVFPRPKYMSTFDANGNYWPAIKTPQGPVVKAGDIVKYSKNSNSPLLIKNLSDHGPYFPYKSKYKTAEFNYSNGTFSDDIILHEGYPRKSILYNNGDFDLSNPNIYKAVAPLVIGYSTYNKYAE